MSKEQESFTLLRLSEESDSISDVPEIVINARKKKVKRFVVQFFIQINIEKLNEYTCI